MSLQLPKAESTNDVYLLSCFCFKIGIAYIGTIEFQVIEFGKKDDNS